jgi:hypothetical protein
MSVGLNSRWNRSAVLNVRDRFGQLLRRPFLDVLPRFEDILRPDNRAYRVRDQDHWDSLAFSLYGNVDLWPVLAEFNQVVNPFEELPAGRELTIPSTNAVFLDYLDFEIVGEEDLDDREENS